MSAILSYLRGDHFGLPYGTTPTGKPSFRKGSLEALAHPLGGLVREVRRLEKWRGTFVEGYILEKAIGGRVYPEFPPLPSEEGGAVTGRFSSCHPNFENLPERDKEVRFNVRGLALPEEGELWCAAVRDTFFADLSRAREIRLEEWRRRPRWRRVPERFFRLFEEQF